MSILYTLQRPFRGWMLTLAGAGLLLASCSGGNSGATADAEADTLKMKLPEQAMLQVESVVYTVPSPLEMANLMKKAGTKYSAAMLSNPKDVSKYSTTAKQALNLGIYGADLGYVAYFNQSDAAAQYLKAATTLGNSLEISGAFETALLERVQRNLNTQDSLLYIITEQYEAAESHLKSVNRPDVAALIVAGGWIEGLYLATQLERSQPSEMVRTRIGETVMSLNSLLPLLQQHKDNPEVAKLAEELLALRKIYDAVKITYGAEAPKVDKKSNPDMVVVSTGNNSKVEISVETVKAITEKIAAIRKSITA